MDNHSEFSEALRLCLADQHEGKSNPAQESCSCILQEFAKLFLLPL